MATNVQPRRVGPRINFTIPKEPTRLNVKLTGPHQEAYQRLKDRFPTMSDAGICKMALSALDKALHSVNEHQVVDHDAANVAPEQQR